MWLPILKEALPVMISEEELYKIYYFKTYKTHTYLYLLNPQASGLDGGCDAVLVFRMLFWLFRSPFK